MSESAGGTSETPRTIAAEGRRGGARRRFLAGGVIAAPAILTLSGRSALADLVCSISATLSNNASAVVSTNCGVSPACWKNHATSDGWATGPAYQPGSPFASIAEFASIYTAPWSIQPAGSLLDAVNGNIHAVYTYANSSTLTISGAGFLSQCVGALLNAVFFNQFAPPRYPLTRAGVQALIAGKININPILPGQPLTGSMPQDNASAVAAAFNQLITDNYPCGVIT
jgi:hypothetical protein